MDSQSLDQALTLVPSDGGLAARLDPGYSNAPQSLPPERGAPFGGLMAALSVRAARQGLALASPLRAVSVQFLAGARFEAVDFTADLLRGGRSTAFAQVRGGQPGRPALAAQLTFGDETERLSLPLLETAPPSPDQAAGEGLDPRFAPWFTRHVDYRFIEGPGLFGRHDRARVGVWMRTADGAPLDAERLCFLLDAVYPVFWTVRPFPPAVATSVDLRYDLFEGVEGSAPDGWAWFVFESRHVGGGWAVEDGAAWSADGRPLALARQLRKLLGRAG